MFDRQVNEQEDPLANRLREEGSERKVRGWPLFGGLLLLLIMAGLFVFRWRLTERTEAVEAAAPAEVLSANSTTKTVAHDANQLPFSVTVSAYRSQLGAVTLTSQSSLSAD